MFRADLERIKQAAKRGRFKITLHARVEMHAEGIMDKEMREAILDGTIVEDYPEDERGHSCLVYGQTGEGRHLHVVVSAFADPPIIITVYEPKPPRWETPTERRPQ